MKESKITTHAFGLRAPESEGIGKWDGAFVYAAVEDTKVVAVFYNKMDHIGHPDNMDEVYKQYDLLRKGGWKPMSIHDLNKTAGIQITKHTNLQPRDASLLTYIINTFVHFRNFLLRIFG